MAMQGVQVSQKELEEMAEHQREMGWRSKRLKEMQSNVIALLQGGASVEPGRFAARLKKCIGRSIPWKQFVIDKLGHQAAEWFRRQHRVHIYYEVMVVEHAIPPLWRQHGDSSDSQS